MKRARNLLFSIFSLALLSSGVFAQAPATADGEDAPFRFAAMSWGADADEVHATLTDLGFILLDDVSTPTDRAYADGLLLGHDAAVIARMYQGELVKVSILLDPDPEARIFDDYDDVVGTLTEKYGSPTNDALRFDRPYEEGDGYEVTALRMGKAHAMTLWQRPTSILGVQLTDKALINIGYEGPMWPQALEAREQAEADVF